MEDSSVKKLIALLICGSMLLASLAGCAPTSQPAPEPTQAAEAAATEAPAEATEQPAPEDLPVLRVAAQPYLLGIPTYYMMSEGLDVANGFKIELSVYANGTLINEALAADEWDIGTGGTSAVFGIATYGAKVIADIDLCTGGAAAFVRADSDIAQVKGEIGENILGNAETIKGSSILVPTGTLNQYNVLKWVEAAGLSSEDVEFVHMDNASAFQAFTTGEGDIVAFSPPMTFAAEQSGWVTAATCTDLGLFCYDPLLANPKSLAEKGDIISAYVKAMYEVCDMFAADHNLAAQWSVKWQEFNGVTTKLEDALREVEARPFVTSDQIQTAEVGTTIYDVAKFFNSVGSLTDEDLAKIPDNLTNEVIAKVFN